MKAESRSSSEGHPPGGPPEPIRRLLYFNLALDESDPILSFACRWTNQFAEDFDEVDVVTFRLGNYRPPTHVRVHVVPKRSSKALRAAQLIWTAYSLLRSKPYTLAFSHMNQVAAALVGPLTKLLRVPLGLWYAHQSVTPSLRIAAWWCSAIFTSNAGGCRLESPKVVPMGHGIDIDLFSPAPSGSRDPQELLELSKRAAPFIVLVIGRISPIKELELVINALAVIPDQTRRAFCIEIHFVGAPQGAQDLSYQESLHALACSCGIDARVTFCGSVPRTLLPAKIRAAGCVVNVSSNTSLDKSLLEGMACAVPVLGAKQYASVLGVSGLGELVVESSPDSIAQGIVQLAKLDPQERQLVGMKLRDIVVREHALGPLVARIVNSFGTCRTSQN